MIACAIYLGRAVKREMVLRSPLLAAAGALGFDALDRDLFPLDWLGALITPPLTWRPTPLARGPRLAHTNAGYLLRTGRANPGLRAAVRRYAGAWRRLGVPVIAALYAGTVDYSLDMGAFLASAADLDALELHLPHDLPAEQVGEHVAAVRSQAGIPCLVRLPLLRATELARAAEEAGADALVVADPPLGRTLAGNGSWIYGPLHSPALAPVYAQQVREVAQSAGVPIIARGGLATLQDVLGALAAGAVAVQLDSILWRQPSALAALYEGLEAEMERRGAATWDELLTQLDPERQRGAD